MKLFYFDKIIYKGNINRDFFLYCCKKNKWLYLYIFIHWFYYILGLFSKHFSLLYIKGYHKYIKKIDNIDKIIDDFSRIKSRKINKWYKLKKDSNNIIIAIAPLNLVKKFISNEKVIAFNLNDKNEIELNKFYDDISSLPKEYEEIFFSNHKQANNFMSEYSYIYMFGSFILYNKSIQKKFKIITTIVMILLLSFLLLLISYTFANVYLDYGVITKYLFDFELSYLNILPIILVMVLMLALTKKLWISFSLTSLLVFIIGIINKTKLYYRNDIFKFSDIGLFKEAVIMGNKYGIIIRWYTIVLIILCILIIFWLRKNIKKIKLKYRYCLIIALFIGIVGFYQYKYVLTNNDLYKKVGNPTGEIIYIETKEYQMKGLIYPFIYSSTEISYKAPSDYNKTNAKTILEKYRYDNIPEDQKVNIIGIMLEVYNDFSKFKNIEIKNEVYEKLHIIEKNSISGNIIVDIFGGGTINTERHFLTGYITFPNFRGKTNSYVSYFKEQGYKTEAMHPYLGSFYNRNTANLNMGFEKYWNYENRFYNYTNNYIVADEIFFKHIIEGLESSNKPYFNFSVTYQNHGPYSSEDTPYNYIVDKGYTKETINTFNRYLQGIASTNNALYELVEYLQDYDKPTILIVFGDHNPYLGGAYEELGIDLSLNSIESYENYYSIPYFIYGNNAAKKTLNKTFKETGATISSNFLMNELFEYIGYEGNEYLKYTSYIKEHVSVISNIYNMEDNEYCLKEESKYQNLLNEFNNINYYYATNPKK